MNLAGRTVLVVEDESIIAMALEDMLHAAGASTLPTASLAEAAALLEGGEIDAAILDVNVYGESSFALAEQLLERAIPFIFATGYGSAVHPPSLAEVPTVSKPYNLADIARAFAALG